MTGPANLGPEMATSALAAFGPAGWMFVTSNVSGKFPSAEGLSQVVVGHVALVGADAVLDQTELVWYDTPGSVTWLQRLGQLVRARQRWRARRGAAAGPAQTARPMRRAAPAAGRGADGNRRQAGRRGADCGDGCHPGGEQFHGHGCPFELDFDNRCHSAGHRVGLWRRRYGRVVSLVVSHIPACGPRPSRHN